MVLTKLHRIIVRLLLVLSLFATLSVTTFDATPVEAGVCVGGSSGNCG